MLERAAKEGHHAGVPHPCHRRSPEQAHREIAWRRENFWIVTLAPIEVGSGKGDLGSQQLCWVKVGSLLELVFLPPLTKLGIGNPFKAIAIGSCLNLLS